MTGIDDGVAKAKTKAMEIIKSKQLHKNLWRAYHTVSCYGAWCKRPDFDAEWNIGVTNVSGAKEAIDNDFNDDKYSVVNFDAFDQIFTLGGMRVSNITPDGYYSYWSIFYRYNGNTIAHLRYSDGDDLPNFCTRLTGVEEFHFDADAFSAIAQINRLIDEYDDKRDRKAAAKLKERYSGKFTF